MKKNLRKLMGVLLGTLIVVCIGGCGKDTAYYVESESEAASMQTESTEEASNDTETLLYVYVCGQVAKPGVYMLPEGSRVCDLFDMAGGLTQKAATDYWNQARLLTDGEMLYVPTIEEVTDRQLKGDQADSIDVDTGDENKVNINTASKEELMTLPGIGESKALAILEYRQKNGSFSSIEELKKVEGIKDGVFSKIIDFIEIN